MKKNDWILLVSVLAYSYLFYETGLGINFFLFSCLLIIQLVMRNAQIMKSPKWLIAALSSILSAFCIFWFGNHLSLIANIVSLMLLSALSYSPETSVITSLFFSFYSVAGSGVFMILNTISRLNKKVNTAANRSGFIKFMLYVLPFSVLILFFLLYKGSNPVFDNFTDNINLDFISPGWIFFTFGGTFLLYGFYYHQTISAIEIKDQTSPNLVSEMSPNSYSWLAKNLTVENEIASGVVVLALLNGLLLVVNVLDLNYLWLDGKLPEGLTYSDFVHQGTGLLISSIVIAILIIMFYFRGSINLYQKNKTIKLLAYLWIVQNAFMIISTALRNDLYIDEYSLTYKRIGVYVWLLLAFIGLVVTFLKIVLSKTNWYLFRVNSWIFYLVLVFSCFVSWDRLVLNFNVQRAEQNKKTLDKFYLLSLSDNVIPELLILNDSIKDVPEEEQPFYFRSDSRYRYRDGIDFKEALNARLYRFLDRMSVKDWRSFNIADRLVFDKIMELNKNNQLTELSFNGIYTLSLKLLSAIDHLKSLRITNSYFQDIRSLRFFKNLEKLDLSNNFIKSISLMPHLPELKELSISGNEIQSIVSLGSLSNLEKLDISGNNIKNFSVLLRLKKLNYLKIGKITPQGLLTLEKTLPGVKIEAEIINVNQ
jgi:hypothetical protein